MTFDQPLTRSGKEPIRIGADEAGIAVPAWRVLSVVITEGLARVSSTPRFPGRSRSDENPRWELLPLTHNIPEIISAEPFVHFKLLKFMSGKGRVVSRLSMNDRLRDQSLADALLKCPATPASPGFFPGAPRQFAPGETSQSARRGRALRCPMTRVSVACGTSATEVDPPRASAARVARHEPLSRPTT